MPKINIHTSLGVAPRVKSHEILVITRGSTASIDFPLFDKVYRLNDIDQLTCLFKQGKDLWAFQMIEYFKPTSDEFAIEEKKYYEKVDVNQDNLSIAPSSMYKFEHRKVPIGASVSGLFEEYELPDGEITHFWQFNSHFSYSSGTYSYITLMLDSSETKQFKLTSPDNNMQFEVAIKLNTDTLEGLHNKDSVIIVPQHPIAVIDSLYSKII